jgi:alpha-beta hydrolase superfamily lysophospholipase
MILDKELLSRMAEELPPLSFVADKDRIWPLKPDPQTYLNYYRINFSNEFPGVSHGFGRVDSGDFRVATHYWLPPEPKGTMVIVHGYYDHVGVYRNPVRLALEHGYAVLAFDLPGHGLSSGMTASIDSFDHYADVLADLLDRSRELLPPHRFALGQSMGGAVLLNYCWRYSADDFAKIALCAPLILPRGWRSGRMIYRLLKGFISHVPRRFTPSSHDVEFADFIARRDPLQSQYLSVVWITAMKIWAEGFRHFSPLDKRMLIVQGTGDRTVEWRYNLEQLQEKLPNAIVKLIDNAGHHLVNESPEYRDQVFAHLQRYFFNH